MDYVMDMTWREYQLRRAGYFRQNKEKWIHTRFQTYYTLASTGAIETKKMSINKFLPLGDEEKKRKSLSKSAIETFKQAQLNYLKETQ